MEGNAASGLSRLDIFRFDNSLFKSPMPNKLLFNEESVEMLTSPDSARPSLDWFANTQVLLNTGKTYKVEKPLGWSEFWNESLVQLVKLSMEDPEAATILVSPRSGEVFGDIIEHFCGCRGLQFDKIVLDTNQRSLAAVMAEWNQENKGLTEVAIYTSDAQEIQLAQQVQFGKPVELFCVETPYQMSFLQPEIEVKIVQEMVNNSNAIGRWPLLELRRSIFWSYYMLSAESRRRLLSSVVTDEFIAPEERSGMIFEAEGVLIGKNQLSHARLQELGGLGKQIVLGTVSQGSIPGRIYAVKVMINDERAQTYFREPYVVVARGKDVLMKEVEEIENWQITKELVSLDAVIDYKQVLKIHG